MTKPARILVADNNSEFQEAVGTFLELHGYRVLHAQTPSEARELMEADAVDLAVLDLRLWDDSDENDASGLTLAREIALHIPKIIHTSYPSFRAVRDALGLKSDGLPTVVGFVAKSEGLPALLSSIKRALAIGLEWERRNQEMKGSLEAWPLPEVPEDLVASCAAGECVLYSGSGLSAQFGLPTWKPFVSNLVEWALSNGFMKDEFAASLREAIETGDLDPVADSVVSAIGTNSQLLHAYLKETFLKGSSGGPLGSLPQSHVNLQQIPFCAALTTNFDNLLEGTFNVSQRDVFTPHDTDQLRSALLNRRLFLLKLYGTLTRPDTLLVAPAQYRASVSENLRFSQFMESLFFSRTLLFIGASLEGIEGYLSGLKFRGSNPLRQHYALVNLIGGGWQAKAEVLQRRFSIKVLPYTASQKFPEVNQFIGKFSTLVRSLQTETGGVLSSHIVKSVSRTKLLRVRLENIGPFSDQTFELGQPWNLLLGDNGVGKSTVLKAIAVGIVGEAAKDFAEHLIRVNWPSGTITLEVESGTGSQSVQKTYVTKLLRSDTGAEVQTLPTRALEAEDWLVIGLPPLRYMNWERESEPSSVWDVPVPADLLPLISSQPDPRPNQIKNWLFDLDHRIQRELNEGLKGTANIRLRDSFYEVLSGLTPGLTIKPGKIDLEKQTITVMTDDGEVPIEYVSQGTISLIGWIGVLLRRLYETYGKQADPKEHYALVLIDEIDAHMHPAWQRLVAPQIRRLFPNVQVVATTHSPLIVSSLLPAEILRLERDSETKQVTLSVPNYSVQDYRSDQILTSPLFGLESSLSPLLQQQVNRYSELAAKDQLTSRDQSELEELAFNISIELPSLAERAEARIAYNLIRYALDKHLVDMDSALTEKVTEEMKVQLQELISGSRRP